MFTNVDGFSCAEQVTMIAHSIMNDINLHSAMDRDFVRLRQSHFDVIAVKLAKSDV